MQMLVTGGGGFLGKAIIKQLLAENKNHIIISFSRNYYPELKRLGIIQIQGDLDNYSDVIKATVNCELIFHVAAKTGSWGNYKDYYQTNVVGTENIIKACRLHKIKKLVYTSSPSVVFNGKDMENVDESIPYADHYLANYPKTKAEAERKILAANDKNLMTTALRPHLIWGAGDTNLVGRIISRGHKLRKIGENDKLIDTIYIDDAANAHILAAKNLSNAAGKAYFISSGQPIATWTMINHILAAVKLPPIMRTISAKSAYKIGYLLEIIYKLFWIKSEPPLTRWVATELATAHWFNISAAKRDFNYEPKISLEAGLKKLSLSLQS
jgi:nucleoside-diphosphate-sugar epimerase